MRRIFASVTDVGAGLVLGYLGFRLGEAVSPCPNPAHCLLQIPLSIGAALIFIVVYFAAGYQLWNSTPGEHLARTSEPR